MIKEVTMRPKKVRFADEICKRYGKLEYKGGKVLQRWRDSGGNVRLFYLLMSFSLQRTARAVLYLEIVMIAAWVRLEVKLMKRESDDAALRLTNNVHTLLVVRIFARKIR